MRKQSVEAIVRALNDSRIRYLIVGGLAVVAHGYTRFTADVDVVLDLESSHLPDALAALAQLGYRPRAPVALAEFADAAKRSQWIQEKGIRVFSLQSPAHPETELDLFVESPLDFEKAYQAAVRVRLSRDLESTFIGYDDLLSLKHQAARPQDMMDVQQLKRVREGGNA